MNVEYMWRFHKIEPVQSVQIQSNIDEFYEKHQFPKSFLYLFAKMEKFINIISKSVSFFVVMKHLFI